MILNMMLFCFVNFTLSDSERRQLEIFQCNVRSELLNLKLAEIDIKRGILLIK